MVHTGPMPEDAGTFKQWNKMEYPCPQCGSPEYYWAIWESNDGAYEDIKRECKMCHYTLWVEGIDS